MSFISGLGRTDYSIPVVRSASQSPEADFLSLSDSTVQPTAVGSSSASAQSSASSQQEQDREEAFAKMMVNLQNPMGQVASTDSSDSSDNLTAASAVGGVTNASSATGTTGTTGTQSAADQFKDYMALTPAQKMRYGALKSMGLTEADLKAMSPDAAAKVETKLADIIKKQTEMQAAAAQSGGAAGSGTSASTDDKGNTFLNSALVKMTQAANETNAKLDLA
ncbi:hypothetical protein QN386_08380 [Pseudomonas sp. CCI3.2]|uniref:hypothetical protein n=1 Tax=unclassified Pseudomonas TaxID=196821 RepID=UPI002AC9543F|nr:MULTISPECIES: hypothetical protein [unclassified Pseudomonas]MEB0077672.1 hypothetical protein [Pseudomonas sp. MH10out]MEB0093892.1 hypothetical protein [Pseudomonas sp. CCI4.2]MEB0101334.1 hypothetical protein [Pseudomonas sp. CCI3.2]MEB0131441.1 hypothetical protein [Pseudomonas sp. CCI2.4]MEB0158451.1 hypothetical protein [Pseudomonas sp. AH2 (2023)]